MKKESEIEEKHLTVNGLTVVEAPLCVNSCLLINLTALGQVEHLPCRPIDILLNSKSIDWLNYH